MPSTKALTEIFAAPLLRLAICALIVGIYYLYPNDMVAYAMLAVALLSTVNTVRAGPLPVALFLVFMMQVLWVATVFAVHAFGLSPLTLTAVRSSYLDQQTTGMALFVASQFLFILTAITIRPDEAGRRFSLPARRTTFSLIALAVAVAATLIINGGPNIIGGGYGSYRTSYWAGLPGIFVIAISAWMILQKTYNLRYLLILNAIIAWWLLHANRSEVLLVFLFGNYLFLYRRRQAGVGSLRQIVLIGAAAILAFVTFSFVGEVRSSGLAAGYEMANPFNIVEGGRLRLQTFGSSVYSVLVAIKHADTFGFFWGETFVGHLKNILPSFIPTPWGRAADVSQNLAGTQILGGVGFVGEAYMNFGAMGPALVAFVFAVIMNIAMVRARGSLIATWFVLTMALYSSRFLLYGVVYFANIMFFFAGVLLVAFVLSIGRRRRGVT